MDAFSRREAVTGVPGAPGGGVAGERAEVPRRAAERALHAVRHVGIAAVEHLSRGAA